MTTRKMKDTTTGWVRHPNRMPPTTMMAATSVMQLAEQRQGRQSQTLGWSPERRGSEVNAAGNTLADAAVKAQEGLLFREW